MLTGCWGTWSRPREGVCGGLAVSRKAEIRPSSGIEAILSPPLSSWCLCARLQSVAQLPVAQPSSGSSSSSPWTPCVLFGLWTEQLPEKSCLGSKVCLAYQKQLFKIFAFGCWVWNSRQKNFLLQFPKHCCVVLWLSVWLWRHVMPLIC